MNSNPNKGPSPHKPGAMTMAMAAVQAKPTGPKVLRIGISKSGNIVEERTFRKRETVTVGSSERNHFVINVEGVAAKFKLFQLVGNDYILNFTEGMTGRVALPAGVKTLEALRTGGGARESGGQWQVKLTDNSRGKIVIGDVSILFQFVAMPPVQPRPQLPAAARGGVVRGIDWVFTTFVMFSFMSHFGFVVYLENADWPLDEGLSFDPDSMAARLIFETPPEPEEEEKADEGEEEAAEEAEQVVEKKPSKSSDTSAPSKSADTGPSESVAERNARIAEQAAQAAEQLLLGAFSAAGDGGALADVMAGGVPLGNAADIMAQAQGVDVAQGGAGGTLRTRGGGGQGSGVGGLGGLAKAQGSTAARSEGGAVSEKAVRGDLKLGGGGGDIGGSGDFDAAKVVEMINKRKGAIRACYEKELKRNPSLAGKVTVEFTIQESGSVTGAKDVENTTGDAAVAGCVVGAVRRFRFNPGPDGGSVTFRFPFVFAPQN